MGELRPVKTAVVGCGMISNVYIRNLKHLFSIIDLVAVCDIRREAAEQKAAEYGVERVMTIDEVAESDEIELVINLTAVNAHFEVIQKMLNAGKHVFTEKTLASDLEQGKILMDLAKKKGLYLGVAPDTVLGAGLQTARGLIEAGFIGRVTSCIAIANRNQALNSEIFPFVRFSKGGAFPHDIGVYYIAALLMLLGPVRSLNGYTVPAPVHQAELLFQGAKYGDSWTLPGSNLACGTLEFQSGAIGSIHFDGNTINNNQNQMMIFGSKGILKLGDPNTFNGSVELILPNGASSVIPLTHGYNGQAMLPDATIYEQRYGHRGVGAAEMAWAIRQNRPNRCSKEFGFHTLEVLCGMDEAAQTGIRYEMTSAFSFKPLPSGYFSQIFGPNSRGDAELSLVE